MGLMTPAASLLRALALVAASTPGARGVQGADLLSFSSADGRFVAVASPLVGRPNWWSVSVRAPGGDVLWSGRFRRFGNDQVVLLAPDGRALVTLEPAFSSGRPIVWLYREGRELRSLSGAALGLERRAVWNGSRENGTPRWFEGGSRAPRIDWVEGRLGPIPHLILTALDESTRLVDLERGELRAGGPPTSTSDPRVEPAAPDPPQAGRLAFQEALEAPLLVPVGVPVELEVRGNLPTPGWRFVGFRLERVSERRLFLHPVSSPPAPGRLAPQVLEPFRSEARLLGLDLGRWEIRLQGRAELSPPVTVEVVPERLLLSLRTTGAVAGVEREIRVYSGNVASLASRGSRATMHSWISDDEEAELASLVGRLPDEDRVDLSHGTADCLQELLAWRRGERFVTARVDERTARGAVQDAIHRLTLLGDAIAGAAATDLPATEQDGR